MPRVARPIADRIFALSSPCPETGCWLWFGYVGADGYGRIATTRGEPPALTHRASYEASVGSIPSGFQVLHRCDVPSCVNPAHLFLGSQQDNMDDMIAKGRAEHPRGAALGTLGEANPAAVLTSAQVESIRAAYVPGRPGGHGPRQMGSTRDLAERFGVSQATISKIVARRYWRHM